MATEGMSTNMATMSYKPIVTVDEFFRDDTDKPYSPLPDHTLEQSPCRSIIGSKPTPNGKYILYYCEICRPEFANDDRVASIYLDAIEHHCKYKDPDRHKQVIISKMGVEN
jgi:hypothetical protein